MYTTGRRVMTERADTSAMRVDMRRVKNKEIGREREKSRRKGKKGR